MSNIVWHCELVQTNLSKPEEKETRTYLKMTKVSAMKYLKRVLKGFKPKDFLQMANGGCHATVPETGDVIRIKVIEVPVDFSKRVRMTPDENGNYVPSNPEPEPA